MFSEHGDLLVNINGIMFISDATHIIHRPSKQYRTAIANEIHKRQQGVNTCPEATFHGSFNMIHDKLFPYRYLHMRPYIGVICIGCTLSCWLPLDNLCVV